VFDLSIGAGMALFGGAVVVKIGLAVWVAMKSSHAFPQARDSGALELLLCTPVTSEQIVRGHMKALYRMFRGPVLLLAVVETMLFGTAIIQFWSQGSAWWAGALYALYFGAFLFEGFLNLETAARFGLWAGLRARRSGQALTWTLLPVAVLPTVAGYCCSVLWPLIGLVKDVVLILYSNQQLQYRFREQVTGRFSVD
jgi:hypothetical protein